MANLNKVHLIGRLTRDPEAIASGKGCKLGFAVSNRRLNAGTGKWEDVPVFIDCECWNRGEGTQATRLLETVRKGNQLFLEGHLKMDSWEDKNGGGKRTAIRLVIDSFQYLESKPGGSGESRQPQPAKSTRQQPADEIPEDTEATTASFQDDDIPF